MTAWLTASTMVVAVAAIPTAPAEAAPNFKVWDTAWMLPARASQSDITTYLTHLQSSGFDGAWVSIVPFYWMGGVSWPLEGVSGNPTFLDQSGAHSSFADPNPAWLDRIEFILDEAEARGVQIGLVVAWGADFTGTRPGTGSHSPPAWDAWIDHNGLPALPTPSTAPNTSSDAYQYGVKLAERFASKPAVAAWVMGGDYMDGSTEHITGPTWAHISRALRDNGATQDITYQTGPNADRVHIFANEWWQDFLSPHTGHCLEANEVQAEITSIVAAYPSKPVISSEMRYEAELASWCNVGVVTPQMVEADAQAVANGGGAGIVFGHSSRWNWNGEQPNPIPPLQSLGSPGEQLVLQVAANVGGNGNLPPAAVLAADHVTGLSPLLVNFDASGSNDPNLDPLSYAWDLDGDGEYDDATGVTAQATFPAAGTFTVGLEVSDGVDAGTDSQAIVVKDPTSPWGGQPLPRGPWTVDPTQTTPHENSSETPDKALDGDAVSFYHSRWTSNKPPLPHDYVVDLGGEYDIDGWTYLPRQWGQNGEIAAFQVFVSDDGSNWEGPVHSGTLPDNHEIHVSHFSAPVTGSWVRLRVNSVHHGSDVTSIAELNITGTSPGGYDDGLLLVGDSITEGTPPGAGGDTSYRCDLWGLLAPGVDFKGSRPPAGSCPDGTFDDDHDGFGGQTTAQRISDMDGSGSFNLAYDAALLHIGTNDKNGVNFGWTQNYIDTVVEPNFRLMVSRLRQNNPTATIYTSQLIPCGFGPNPGDGFLGCSVTHDGGLDNNSNPVEGMNEVWERIAADSSTPTSPIVLIDHRRGFSVASDLKGDGVHPDPSGRVKMADNWALGLETLFAGANLADPVSASGSGTFPWSPSDASFAGRPLTCAIVPNLGEAARASVNADCSSGSFNATGLAPGQYTFRYSATDLGTQAHGSATHFGEVTVTVTAGGPPPDPPSGLSATADSETQITTTWVDNSTNEDAFELERSTDGGPFTPLTTTVPDVVAFSDAPLISGTEHCYRVRAVNGGGASAYSNVACATTLGSPPTVVYLSDLTPTLDLNGWGPSERDMSNGEMNPFDGTPIQLQGVTYPKGIGAHADSDIRFDLTGLACTTFRSDIGIDDDKGPAGNVVFEVYTTPGGLRYASPPMTGSSATLGIDLDVSGATELRLVVDQNGDTNSDWADWADAKLLCTPASGLGSSVDLDGTNGADGATVAGGVPGLGGDLTLEAWVRWDDGSVGRSIMGSTYLAEGEVVVWPGGQLAFYHGDGVGGFQGFGSSQPLVLGRWTHVVVTRDVSAGVVRWYVDGILTNELAMGAVTPVGSTADFRMGYGTLAGWVGGIDEVAAYDRVLTPTEVAEHFSGLLDGDDAAYGQLVGGDAPLAYYRLDETAGPVATDAAGTNDGAYAGSPVLGQPGAIAFLPSPASVTFDQNAAVVVANNPSLQVTGDLTLEGWIRWDDPTMTVGRSLFGKSYLGEGQVVLWPGGQLGFYHGDGAVYQGFLATQAVPAGQWTHVAVTRDVSAGVVSWYIDGSFVNSVPMDPAVDPIASGASFRLGYQPLGLWDGGLDEIAVYDSVLTSQAIGVHHAAIGDPAAYGTTVIADSPVAYWRLDESGGRFARDTAGLRHGTYLGTPALGQAPAD